MICVNLDEMIKFHQELLNQQRDHKAIQKETIKLVNILHKNVELDDKLIQNTLESSTALFDASTRLLNGVHLTEIQLSESTGDSDDEKETIQIKKKPKLSNTRDKESDECNSQQRLFNKYVRESVEQRLGKDFLVTHEIQEIDTDIMEEIKTKALETYPPVNIRPRRAWHLAKASLRCRRRSLRRQKEKLANTLNSTSLNQEEF